MVLTVGPAPPPPELMKATFNLPLHTVGLLKAYGKAYLAHYHAEADEDYLINSILIAFLESDKAFLSFLKDHPEIEQEIQGQSVVKKPRKPREKKTPPTEPA